MKAWISAGLVAALGILFAVPTAAPAKPGYFEFHGSRSMDLSLRGSNGFEIFVSSSAGRTQVTASKRRVWVGYFPRGRSAKGERIDAALPGIGRVSVEFRSIGEPRRIEVFPGCKGRPGYDQPGVSWARSG